MTPRISLGQTNPFVGTREEVTRLVRRCPRTQTCRLGRSAASPGSSAGAQRARTKPLRPLPPNPDLGSALDKPSAKSHGALRPPTARRLSRGGVCLGEGCDGSGRGWPAGLDSPTPAPPLRLPLPASSPAAPFPGRPEPPHTSARPAPSQHRFLFIFSQG